MGRILRWIENKEHLKLAIMSYEGAEIDLINFSDHYWLKNREIFRRRKDKRAISRTDFSERLFDYIWTPKVSELLIILYLEDMKGENPTIYGVNKLLRRTKDQYSATFKTIKKLENLDIVYTKPIKGSNRQEKQIFIKKGTVTLYGDEVFRQMMLDEWNTDAKEYIKIKLKDILGDKKKVEKNIMRMKKGKRVKKYGWNFV